MCNNSSSRDDDESSGDEGSGVAIGCGFFAYAIVTGSLWYFVSWHAGVAFLVLGPMCFFCFLVSWWAIDSKSEDAKAAYKYQAQETEARELINLIDDRSLNWEMSADYISLYDFKGKPLVKIKNVFYGNSGEKFCVRSGPIAHEYARSHPVWKRSKELATFLYNDEFARAMEMLNPPSQQAIVRVRTNDSAQNKLNFLPKGDK